jgi:hypothetical protein
MGMITHYHVDGSRTEIPVGDDPADNIGAVCYADRDHVATFHDVWTQALEVLPGQIRCKVISTESTYADLLEQAYYMVRTLAKHWPRTFPTLDEVRAGRASADGTPWPPAKDVTNG